MSHAEQREALTEDVDGSGGEQESASMDDPKTSLAKQHKTLRDSAAPFLMISAFLSAFGALAAVAIFVVSEAFGDHDAAPDEEPTETVDAACGDSTSWRLLGVVVFACLSLT